jgi:hypothetical protein
MKFLIWFKNNIWSLVVGLIAVLGAGIFWRYHRGQIQDIRLRGILGAAKAKVELLDSGIKDLKVDFDRNRSEIKVIETKRKKLLRDIVRIQHNVEIMSDEEIERSFQDLF